MAVQQRALSRWSAYAYPVIARATRSLMEVVSYNASSRILTVKDSHGQVTFQGADIPTDTENRFSFNELAKAAMLPPTPRVTPGLTITMGGGSLPKVRDWVVVEDRLGTPKLLRHARSIEVRENVVTYASSYKAPCGGYSILHRIRTFHDDGSVNEVVKTYNNENSRSFSVRAIAKRHLKPGIWAVEIEIPENSPGYYGTLLNPGADLPLYRLTRDTLTKEAVGEKWDAAQTAWV